MAIVVEALLLEAPVDRRLVGPHGREHALDRRTGVASARAPMTPSAYRMSGADVGLRAREHLEVVRLVLLGDADLDERVQLRPVACRRPGPPGRTPPRRRSGGSARASDRGTRQLAALALPVGHPDGLEALDRRRGDRGVQPRQRDRVLGAPRPDAGRRGLLVGHAAAGSGRSAGAEQDALVAVAREPGLHEQLHVVVRVGAGDVEADRAALRAVAQQVLDEPEADVARVQAADRVQLHDRPLVALALALHAEEPGDVAVALEHVEHVVRLERAERQAEQAEHADRRAGHGQARATACPRRPPWASRDSSPSAARSVSRAARTLPVLRGHRVVTAPAGRAASGAAGARLPSPGSACSAAIIATRRWNRVSPASSGWNDGGDDVALADGDDPAVVEARQDVDVRARPAR